MIERLVRQPNVLSRALLATGLTLGAVGTAGCVRGENPNPQALSVNNSSESTLSQTTNTFITGSSVEVEATTTVPTTETLTTLPPETTTTQEPTTTTQASTTTKAVLTSEAPSTIREQQPKQARNLISVDGFGGINIGFSVKQMYALGYDTKPFCGGAYDTLIANQESYGQNPPGDLEVGYKDNFSVDVISTYSNAYSTLSGVRVGDSVQHALDAYHGLKENGGSIILSEMQGQGPGRIQILGIETDATIRHKVRINMLASEGKVFSIQMWEIDDSQTGQPLNTYLAC